MENKNRKNKYIETIKILLIILIPLIFLEFIFYSNFLVSKDFNYFYDIGSEEDKHLSPENRISDSIFEDDINYRNATGHLVYFYVPIARGAESVKVSARFRDDFPEDTMMAIGASDNPNEWHYKYNWIYNSSESLNTGEWVIKETSFNIEGDNLVIKGGKISLLFNIPHLSPAKNETNINHIPIDWINVTVHKKGWFGK